MSYIKYTFEQYEILDHMVANNGMLLVPAGAGTGKSMISKHVVTKLIEEVGLTSVLYTAFNRAIVEEGVIRFKGLPVTCKNFHALAYSYVKPKSDITDISYSCIKEDISYSAKYKVITAINDFFVSASTDMFQFMKDHLESENLQELAIKYIELMIEGKLNPTFNFLLKYFHLMLVEGTAVCKYDLVILDEINDTTAVALEIFKLIDAPKKLGLGETHQAIYDFLNLVNGFEELSGVPTLSLTQSFRCSISIANKIQDFMQKWVTPDFTFIGTDEPVENGKYLYCTLTNASIIQRIYERLANKAGFHLLRKLSEIFAYPMAIITAGQGKDVYQKKYKFLQEEYKNYQEIRKKGDSFLSHLMEHVDDQETKSAVNLLLSLQRKNINLFKLYKDAKEAPVDLKYTIATVYTSKGLEYETVEIAGDINSRIDKIIQSGGIRTHEDLIAFRCAYVAMSRAGSKLLNANFLR